MNIWPALRRAVVEGDAETDPSAGQSVGMVKEELPVATIFIADNSFTGNAQRIGITQGLGTLFY